MRRPAFLFGSGSSRLQGLLHEEGTLLQLVREGRFQRVLAFVAAMSAALSGGEVAYEHYRGSYNQQVMYTPVILSALLFVTGMSATVSRNVARRVLPIVSLAVIINGVVGFIFHVRGIARKPGGWKVPIVNLAMGPPVLAPLLFGLSGYLGLVASFLRRPSDPPGDHPVELISSALGRPPTGEGLTALIPRSITREGITLEHHIREGRFQRNVAAIAGISALLSGVEASYSHYQNNFQYPKLQWSPLMIAPALGLAGIASVWSRTAARTALPLFSIIALINGFVGTFFHVRGIFRRPGGLKLPLYNLIYGPPIFAPMLFAASGSMGILASLLRRPR